MDDIYREVDFYKYCRTCKYSKTPETKDPCNECLEVPYNEYSVKPINWEEK